MDFVHIPRLEELLVENCHNISIHFTNPWEKQLVNGGVFSNLHGAVGFGNPTSLVGGEVVGWRVKSVIEVEKSVADRVPKTMVDGAATLVPYGAFVERNGFDLAGGE